jgi:uncharacterized membrane protein YhaH (DUF805 family)
VKNLISPPAKILGFVGIVISILSLMATLYLYGREATLISLTRDVAGAAIAESDTYSMMRWIDTLASSWSCSFILIPVLAIILLVYSVLLIVFCGRKAKQTKFYQSSRIPLIRPIQKNMEDKSWYASVASSDVALNIM